MVHENKSNVIAAALGVVVGAGAVIAGAVAMNDQKNRKKVNGVLLKAKEMVKGYANDVEDQEAKVIKSAKLVTKAAKKEVKKL